MAMQALQSESQSQPQPFQFPPHYSFPPFFTLQPNPMTKSSQLQSWSSLILSYSRHHRLFALTLIDALETELFWNKTLNKRLSLRDARDVLSWMASKEGGERIEWIGAGKGKETMLRSWVYWRRPEEWAQVVESWIDRSGQKNTVLTLYELTEGDATISQEFHGMDPDLLQKSLQVSVKRGKAQIFGQDDQLGVKFF